MDKKKFLKTVLSFKINKNKKPFFTSKKIYNYLENLNQDSEIKKINTIISDIFKVPLDDIEFDLKKSFFRKINFVDGVFNSRFKFFYLLKDLTILICFITWYKFFSKNLNIKKKSIIFFDELDNEKHLSYYKKLNKKFNNSSIFFFKKKNIETRIKKKYQIINFKKLCIYNKLTLKNNFFIFFYLIIQILKNSYLNKINLFNVYNLLFFRIFKYDTIFFENRSKYYFSSKIINSSKIKHFFFKKYGGYKIAYIQKNLAELSISFFLTSDIFFSLGNFSTYQIHSLGSNIKKIVPVGSLFLESSYIGRKHKALDIDILNIGINWIHKNNVKLDNKIDINYYRHINWLKKISTKYPHLKILIKHHDNYQGDISENKIINGSNVDIIINDKNNTTYEYILRSKLIFSFGSTMILEAKSPGKYSYFLDPDGLNQSYFKFLKKGKSIKITSYAEFEKTIKKHFYKRGKNNFFSKNKLNNYYCLKSDKVSEKIFQNLV